MTTAILSPKGQITIPINFLRKHRLCGGDEVVIEEQGEDIVIRPAVHPNVKVLREFQKAMEGAAAEAGWTCEQDAIDYCKEIRREIWEERYANNA